MSWDIMGVKKNMCGTIESISSGLERVVISPEAEMTEEQEKDPDILKVFVLRRYKGEDDPDVFRGLDVVVAHTLEEAIDLAEATHPGTKKYGAYKSYRVVDLSYPHFAYGRAFEVQAVHW